MNPLFEISLFFITSITLLLQLYLLFCVLLKSPKKMHPFRFALCLFLSMDFAFTFIMGFVLDPDILIPNAKGAFVNGLAKLFGDDGGRIGFTIAIFFGACMIETQIYGLIFRYTAVQGRWPHLHNQFNLWKTRIGFLIFGALIAISCGFSAFTSIAAPYEIEDVLLNKGHHYKEMMALIHQTHPPPVLLLLNIDTPKGKILPALVFGGFTLSQLMSFIFSLLIYRTLRENASRFSARTYQLHRQLTLLLIFQFFLPFIFVMLPVCYALYALISTKEIISGTEIDKTAGDIGLLLLNIYTLCNSLLILLFITPYRNYTMDLIRSKLLSRFFRNRVSSLEGTAETQETD